MPTASHRLRHIEDSDKTRFHRREGARHHRRGRSPADDLVEWANESDRHHYHQDRRRHRHKRDREGRWGRRSRSFSESSADSRSSGPDACGRRERRWRRRRLESPRRAADKQAVRDMSNTPRERGADQRSRLLSALDEQLLAHRRQLGLGEGTAGSVGGSLHDGGAEVANGKAAASDSTRPCVLSLSRRVVLYGVDLGVRPCHVSSMLEQLVGLHPLNVVRPATQLLETIHRATAPCNDRTNAPTALTDCADAAGRTVGAAGGGVGFIPEACQHLGLYDVGATGGIVLLDLPHVNDVATVVAALNGACLNGRVISAEPALSC